MQNRKKKILLIGEFSGFHTNLKQGLERIGMDVTLASNVDGWKNIGIGDIPLYNVNYSNRIDRAYNYIMEPMLHYNRFCGYDIVQYVNPNMFNYRIEKFMFDKIKKNNGKVFTSISGNCHSLYKSYCEGKLGYYTYDNVPEYEREYDMRTKRARSVKKTEEYFYNEVDGIIPVMYEYAVGVKERKNCKKTIQLPMDITNIKYKPNIVKNKIVIMHGIISERKKGSDYICEALDIIKKRYPNEVEVVIDGKMPLNEYLDVLQNINVLVDQCKEHCWGMNACFGMASGKIVLGGASYNSLKEFGLDSSPVIHIKPDVDQIVEQLEYVISKRNKFEQMGYEARKFVETFHDCSFVAQKYVDTWGI